MSYAKEILESGLSHMRRNIEYQQEDLEYLRKKEQSVKESIANSWNQVRELESALARLDEQ